VLCTAVNQGSNKRYGTCSLEKVLENLKRNAFSRLERSWGKKHMSAGNISKVLSFPFRLHSLEEDQTCLQLVLEIIDRGLEKFWIFVCKTCMSPGCLLWTVLCCVGGVFVHLSMVCVACLFMVSVVCWCVNGVLVWMWRVGVSVCLGVSVRSVFVCITRVVRRRVLIGQPASGQVLVYTQCTDTVLDRPTSSLSSVFTQLPLLLSFFFCSFVYVMVIVIVFFASSFLLACLVFFCLLIHIVTVMCEG
jgi:ABC-type multidrug transport system fused ATPase/permease subunit